jgi:hypothetical protein
MISETSKCLNQRQVSAALSSISRSMTFVDSTLSSCYPDQKLQRSAAEYFIDVHKTSCLYNTAVQDWDLLTFALGGLLLHGITEGLTAEFLLSL